MTILEIFEKVNLLTPIEQRKFFNYFEDTVNELLTLYDGYVIHPGANYAPPETLGDVNVIRELYHNSIIDNILFLAGMGDTYKGEFIRKSRLAFLKYWNDDAKGRRVRRMRW